MTRDEVVSRCIEWGAWLRGSAPTRVAMSAEGAYRSPQPWDAPIASWRDGIDAERARQTEAAVCNGLDIYHHTVLRCYHVHEWAAGKCLRIAAQAAGTPTARFRAWEGTLQAAYGLLGGVLDTPAVWRRPRAAERVQAALRAFAAVDED